MTAMTRSAIPTTYRGTNFRSRLEARWAAFFDLVGWRWTYEPVDADGYIPDFLIHGRRPFFVEVGPCVSEDSYKDKASKAVERPEILGHDVLVVGVSPMAGFGDWPGNPTAGVLLEFYGPDRAPDNLFWPAPGVWGMCLDPECRQLGIVHTEGMYVLRPCSHHQSGSFGGDVSEDFLEGVWAHAGNDTQWRGQVESVGTILHRLAR